MLYRMMRMSFTPRNLSPRTVYTNSLSKPGIYICTEISSIAVLPATGSRSPDSASTRAKTEWKTLSSPWLAQYLEHKILAQKFEFLRWFHDPVRSSDEIGTDYNARIREPRCSAQKQNRRARMRISRGSNS